MEIHGTHVTYTKQTWANGVAGGTPISAARLTHMEEGIYAAHLASGHVLESGGVGVNAALAINAATLTNPTIVLTGVHYYSTPILFGTDDRNIVFAPGAQLLKATTFTDLYSIEITGERVKFFNFYQDGQRATAANQTYGMVFAAGALDCEMHYSTVKSNKFHGLQVDPGASLSLYDCDISDNVHSPLAGYGVLNYGIIRTYGDCTFNNNGRTGIYTDVSTSDWHIEGQARTNGARGFDLSGDKGTAIIRAQDNGFIDVVLDRTHACNVDAESIDAGKTSAQDGIAIELLGSSGNTLRAKVIRPRGFGIAIARRFEQPTRTVVTDGGGETITFNASTAAIAAPGAGVIENEYLTWTGKSGSDLTGITRGQRGTATVAHPATRDLMVIPSSALTADPGAGGTTWAVGSTAAFTSSGFAWCQDEIVTYTAKTATQLLNVRRGQLNTTAATHAIGQVVAPFLESHRNTIVLDYDGYGSPDGDPGIQISGGSSYNDITAVIRNALVPVSIGEEPWPKNNDHNIIRLYAENCVYGGVIITGGNNNYFPNPVLVDCWNFDAAISTAAFYFNDQRANLSAYGFGTVNNNKVTDYEIRTISAPAPTNKFAQLNTASGNTAETFLTGTVVWDPPSVADNAATTTTFSIPGAKVGDICTAAFSTYVTAGAFLVAHVFADDEVVVALYNRSGGALDLASGTVRVVVHKFGA